MLGESVEVHPDASLPCAQPNNNQPRLIITKIVMNNFKSYAGVVEIGPFHKVKKKKDRSYIY